MKISDCSFLNFVYPFLFDSAEFESRVKAIQSAGKSGRNSLVPAWEPQEVHSEDLLPHVLQYLNPKRNLDQAGHAVDTASAYLWRLGRSHDNPYRLSAEQPWQFFLKDRREGAPPGAMRAVPFRLGGETSGVPAAQLALFGIGVGLLTIHVRLGTETTEDWLDFLHYFRYITRDGRIEPPAGFSERFAGAMDPASGTFAAILWGLLETGSSRDESRWWQDVYVPGKMLPFAALFVDTDGGAQVAEAEQAEFRYRVQNFFRSGQEVRPSAYHLREDSPSRLPYAAGQDFLFSIEGGAFLAFDALKTQFFRETLPGHLRQEYFLLFLLALHQRFALMGLSGQVAKNWPLHSNAQEDAAREETFQKIRTSMLAFTARGYFAQAMQREHHHRSYQKWQDTFQIPRLYQEVRDEIREMHEYLLMKQTKYLREIGENQRVQSKQQEERAEKERDAREKREKEVDLFITSATLAIAVPALTFGFLAINIEAYKLTVAMAACIAAGAFLVSILTTAVVWWRRPTRGESPKKPRNGKARFAKNFGQRHLAEEPSPKE